jgi:hypothetical protein
LGQGLKSLAPSPTIISSFSAPYPFAFWATTS